MKRRGKKLLGPGAVAAVSDVEGGLAVAAALPEIDNARAREERETWASASRGREREKSYHGPEDKMKNKWAHSKTVWAESQLRFKVRYCRMPSLVLPQSGTAALPKIVGVSYNLYDCLCIRYGHISPIYHDRKQIINIDHDHDT